MAEIKSTLELAMERMRKVAISEEEKVEIKRKEISQKATGLFHRYREGHLSLNEILRETGRMESGEGAMVKKLLLSQWIDALSLDGDNETILKGIETLKGKEVDDARQRLNHLVSEYRKEKEKAEEAIKTQLRDGLKKEGIHGSAVVPHIAGQKGWKELLGTIDRTFRGRIEEVREALREL